MKQSAFKTAAIATGVNLYTDSAQAKSSIYKKKKVIILGIDGMDPFLCEQMLAAGRLPNLDKIRKIGGYSRLGTSIPPQSPVAWANFITGSNPGKHGIFSFVGRDPRYNYKLRDSIAKTIPGVAIPVGKYALPIIRRPKTKLLRKGIPFWDYLDEVGIKSDIYFIPSNYPPNESKFNNHRTLSGMGTTDLMGSLGTYQFISENGPEKPRKIYNGIHSKLTFKNETAAVQLLGPKNQFLIKPEYSQLSFLIHRDRKADAVIIEINNQKIILKKEEWSEWIKVNFELELPFIPDADVNGICQFYLKRLKPLELYISPINFNPANPESVVCQPKNLSKKMVKSMGLFATLGIQEAFKARNEGILDDIEYASQCELVLQERLNTFDYALENYSEGVLFFYFSSIDLQSHFFWWDKHSQKKYPKHPYRSKSDAIRYHDHIKKLYVRMDNVVGKLLDKYGDKATIIVLSDHGFCNFCRFFNLNKWLLNNGYIRPSYCTALSPNQNDITAIPPDWSKTKAYGVGVNALFLNLKGRELSGSVTKEQRELLINELISKLKSIRDTDGSPVIREVYRGDEIYSGPAMDYAPDLVLGFHRGYRGINPDPQVSIIGQILSDAKGPWSADHSVAAEEVPGVLFCNRPIDSKSPSLIDIAPSILELYELQTPDTMDGHSVLSIKHMSRENNTNA